MEKDKRIIKIPFHKVVVGNFPKDFFKDKIVIVGLVIYLTLETTHLPHLIEKTSKHPIFFFTDLMIQSSVENKTCYPEKINICLFFIDCFIFIYPNKQGSADKWINNYDFSNVWDSFCFLFVYFQFLASGFIQLISSCPYLLSTISGYLSGQLQNIKQGLQSKKKQN